MTKFSKIEAHLHTSCHKFIASVFFVTMYSSFTCLFLNGLLVVYESQMQIFNCKKFHLLILKLHLLSNLIFKAWISLVHLIWFVVNTFVSEVLICIFCFCFFQSGCLVGGGWFLVLVHFKFVLLKDGFDWSLFVTVNRILFLQGIFICEIKRIFHNWDNIYLKCQRCWVIWNNKI
jgi:hypothetical protein